MALSLEDLFPPVNLSTVRRRTSGKGYVLIGSRLRNHFTNLAAPVHPLDQANEETRQLGRRE
jgi:hypothetical protein